MIFSSELGDVAGNGAGYPASKRCYLAAISSDGRTCLNNIPLRPSHSLRRCKDRQGRAVGLRREIVRAAKSRQQLKAVFALVPLGRMRTRSPGRGAVCVSLTTPTLGLAS